MKKLLTLTAIGLACLAGAAQASPTAALELDVPAGSTVLVLDSLEEREFDVAEVHECQCGCPGFPQSWNYATGFSKMNACANARAGMRMNCVPIVCN